MEQDTDTLSASQQDYLEAELFAVRRDKVARVRDIARSVGVGMPSVTAALKALSKRKLINYDPYQFVTLTEAGREAAEAISRRHHDLRRFFVEVLGVDEAQADANACRIEHAVDDELLDRLRSFIDFVLASPQLSAFRRQHPSPKVNEPRENRHD